MTTTLPFKPLIETVEPLMASVNSSSKGFPTAPFCLRSPRIIPALRESGNSLTIRSSRADLTFSSLVRLAAMFNSWAQRGSLGANLMNSSMTATSGAPACGPG